VKKTVLLSTFLLLLGSMSLAQSHLEDNRKKIFESQESCDQGIYTDEKYFALSTGHFTVRVYSIADQKLLLEVPAHSRVSDIKIQGDRLFVLAGTRLTVWQLNRKTGQDSMEPAPISSFRTHPEIDNNSHWRKKATGFILKDSHAIIAHGVAGLSVLDLESGKFVKLLPMPTVSSAQDIASVNGDTAVIAVDNDNEAEFRGLYLFDLRKLEIMKQIKIDNALPSAVRVLDRNRLMVVYFNAVWKFELDQTLAASSPRPTRRAWKFPGLFIMDMIGKVAFDQKYLYACFNTLDQQTDKRKIKPLAVDLEAIKLN
jgi:hypothetical protein